MERDQATKFINDLLKLMVGRNGSDLFITADFPPAIKVDGKVTKVSPQPLNASHTLALARSIMSDKQAAEFERTKECNFAISPPGIGRFRVNSFVQQSSTRIFRCISVLPRSFSILVRNCRWFERMDLRKESSSVKTVPKRNGKTVEC